MPSQHQYQSSSKQSLLRAGLESGLNMIYGCDGGNCGKCLVRLVSGTTERLRHSDFVLSQSQKDRQQLLSCCHAASSDVVMEAVEIDSVSEIAEQTIDTRVYRMDRLSESVMSVVLKTPRGQPLSFLAGQYVTLSMNGSLQRNKSIASCPCDGMHLEVHVKAREHDPFSEYVFKRLKKNERVQINGPHGEFVLDDASDRPLLLIAFDSGFSSIKSLIEHAIALEKNQPIKLYWMMSAGNQPYLENYCRSIVHALDNFSFQTEFAQDRSPATMTQLLEKIVLQEAAVTQSDVYLTLPEELRELAQDILIQAGVQPQHWKIDTIQAI
ncbi:MAG: 2Fe-2S iron-sulfur cluster binding domain-containing protein [Gammaproteobacteria bacterium]|nr:2Fe-2S iron-sulfur cluster binding domain-containing protein [Gammaproteobacteria bacterium]